MPIFQVMSTVPNNHLPDALRPGITRAGNVIYLDVFIARRISGGSHWASVSEFAEAGHVSIPANAQTSAPKNVRIVTPTEKLVGFRTVTEARHKMANAIAADPIPAPYAARISVASANSTTAPTARMDACTQRPACNVVPDPTAKATPNVMAMEAHISETSFEHISAISARVLARLGIDDAL